jgi:hypothetical protein
MIKFEIIIKNQYYESKDEIVKKLRFYKRDMNQKIENLVLNIIKL